MTSNGFAEETSRMNLISPSETGQKEAGFGIVRALQTLTLRPLVAIAPIGAEACLLACWDEHGKLKSTPTACRYVSDV